MGRNTEDQIIIQKRSKASMEIDLRKALLNSMPKSPIENGRPSSMVIKVNYIQLSSFHPSKNQVLIY